MRRTLAAAGLACGYLLLLGQATVADALIALALGYACAAAARRIGPPGPAARSPRTMPLRDWAPFAAFVLRDVAAGSWQMALASLRLRPLSDAGIVAVPVDPDDPRAALIAWAETISPGSVLVDVDHERGRLLFHVFDASAPHELRASLDRKHGCWSGR